MQTNTKAYIHFADGTTFSGLALGTYEQLKNRGLVWGEAAFTTGMTGYQETITDPSFLGQHIIFSASHIANYPADPRVAQALKTFATSIITREITDDPYWQSIPVPVLMHFDTRALVRYLAQKSKNHISVVSTDSKPPASSEFSISKLHCSNLDLVSNHGPKILRSGDNPIVIMNYGIKQAIVDQVVQLGHPVVMLNHRASFEEIKNYQPRLVFLSNGPGDPTDYKNETQVIEQLINNNIPIRAICLGHQLTSIALGAKTYKLPFGHRGINHPVIDHITGKVLITSQNHGYATDLNSMQKIIANKKYIIGHSSLFDGSIEGIVAVNHHIKTVQHHPEANPGTHDANSFFSEIKTYLNGEIQSSLDPQNIFKLPNIGKVHQQKKIPYKKIMVIGSGPIKIGQASEFDYSGTQACRALMAEGLDVILVNSNPATIMTDKELVTKTYIEPLTLEVLKKIIIKEKVDAVLSTMGGQTALNLALELEESGFLKSQKVTLLGANSRTIELTENRDLFALELDKFKYSTGKRYAACSSEEAIFRARSEVGYPLIIRRSFALGGQGAALVRSEDELKKYLISDLKYPISLERSLVGFKEVELEVMVDCEQNGVIVCSIENVDPCGVHTGDSITVAPAQTISDRCLQKMRTMSLNIAKAVGVVAGGANVQFAVNPADEDDITVIEMNPRVSRSSALASKATGYPIAKISALLAVGYTLKDILNDITKVSPVSFEPTQDYVAVKIPLFPFGKFPNSDQTLGPQMRSVGEVLAIGATFNEAFFKALRSMEMGLEIPSIRQLKTTPVHFDKDYLNERLGQFRELSLLSALDGLRLGFSVQEISELTMITPWYIQEIKKLYDLEIELIKNPQTLFDTENFFLTCKRQGFSDKYLAITTNNSEETIFNYRKKHNLFPSYKAVDTCSGEFKAQTPYYYSTYWGENEAIAFKDQGHSAIAIFGSGPNRIGQGIEFDYSCVKSCQTIKKQNLKSIMINSNPETVSTDYDTSDRLYLAPLYSEDVTDIFLHESPTGIIASFSGQTGIRIRSELETGFRQQLVPFTFLGPSLKTIDLTEDRKLFDEVIKTTQLAQTKSREVNNHKKLIDAIAEIGFPVIIRPSYVIGGESMFILRNTRDVQNLPEDFKHVLNQGAIHVLVETYLENAIEYDVDLVRDQHGHVVFTVCEHIEHAGVHSGDSGMITPPVNLDDHLYSQMQIVSKDLADKLEVIGPINFQFAVKDKKIYCIEANPRGSRTLPFLSKATHKNLPEMATLAMLGKSIPSWAAAKKGYYCVKQSTFPFDRFPADQIILGPKMRSTGETMGIDSHLATAILKSYMGNFPKLDQVGKILFSLSDETKKIIGPYLGNLRELGYQFVATAGTADFITNLGHPCEVVAKIGERSNSCTITQSIKDKQMRLVFNTPNEHSASKSDGEYIRNNAIVFGIPCFTRPENIVSVISSIIGTNGLSINPVALQDLNYEK